MEQSKNGREIKEPKLEFNPDVRVFGSVRQFAEHVKHMIDCHTIRESPAEGCPIPSWDGLVQHFGKLMDYATNRKTLLKPSGISKTFRTVLRDDRLELFKKALREYNPEFYVTLL
jgi:hypothetical protein